MSNSTNFQEKSYKDVLYHGEINAIYSAINNVEEAINITPGSSSASIPNTNIASGIDGAKISSTSSLSVLNITSTSLATINNLNLEGLMTINNGFIDIVKLGEISSANYGMIVTDGVNDNIQISNSGEVQLRGVVTALEGSSLNGSANITEGDISVTTTNSTQYLLNGVRKDTNWETAYTHSQTTGNQHSTNHSDLNNISSSDHHDPVTVSGDGVSLSGQQVSLDIGLEAGQVAPGDQVHSGLTPLGLHLEFIGGEIHISWSYKDDPDIKSFLIEYYDEDTQAWVEYDTVLKEGGV